MPLTHVLEAVLICRDILPRMKVNQAEFTVVIPAKNEAQLLPLTLQALERQSTQPREVIVVDNASTDDTSAIARAWGATVLYCARPGVSHARQMGLEAAKTSWVASTDADSQPARQWLKALTHEATQGRVGLYGPMCFAEMTVVGEWITYGLYSSFLHTCRLAGRTNFAGGNMAYSRQAALMVGGFPERHAQEDLFLGQRLATIGEVAYVSRAIVATSPRRFKKDAPGFIWKQMKGLAGCSEHYFDES